LTIWNRWGRLNIVIRKGKPVKKADLETSQDRVKVESRPFTHASAAAMTRCPTSLVGNIGNMAIFPARAVRKACQTVKATQEIPEMTRLEMIAALFQGYWFPPFSRAKQSTTEATRDSTTPGQSI